MIVLPKPDNFLKKISRHLIAKNLNTSDLLIDHLCYRVATEQRYFELKKELEKENKLLIESKVNGRSISVFKLNQPIRFQFWEIPLLELPSPKAGSRYKEGWEHIECVMNESLESFMKKYPNLDFDLKGLSKSTNKEVRLKLGNLSVKFHEMSLEEVIQNEKKT